MEGDGAARWARSERSANRKDNLYHEEESPKREFQGKRRLVFFSDRGRSQGRETLNMAETEKPMH